MHKNKKTLQATRPDGTVATRTTSKEYTHVVFALSNHPYHMSFNDGNPSWIDALWTTRLDLAEKEARKKEAVYLEKRIAVVGK